MEMAVVALANLVTTPRQLPSVPVLQTVLVPAATLRVAVLPVPAQLAVPKRLLQVRSDRSAVLMAAVLPDLPVTVTLAAMAAKLMLGTVSTRPDVPHATVPSVAVALTSAQQLDWSGRSGERQHSARCVFGRRGRGLKRA